MQEIKPENRNPAMMPAPDFAKPEQGAGFERLLRGITGTRADPRETPARQSVPRLSKTRRRALEQQLSLLTEQWEAALQESALSTGAARVRADQQAQQLEQRIRDIERQLDEGAP